MESVTSALIRQQLPRLPDLGIDHFGQLQQQWPVSIGHIDDLAQQGIGLNLKHQAQWQHEGQRFEYHTLGRICN